MAKKKKKDKQRRHQLKKSRQGQARRPHKKYTQLFDVDEDEDEDYYESAVPDNAFGPPVAQDGYRIVGPAQAMADYAKPLFDNADDEDFDKIFSFAQLCWNLVLLQDKDPDEFEKQKKKIAEDMDVSDTEWMIDMMMERFHAMFPYAGKSPGFYVRERVIDIEEFEPFDEKSLNIGNVIIPPDEDEIRLSQELVKLSNNLYGPEEDESEESAQDWMGEITACYAKWCHEKGISDDLVDHFAYAVSSFLDFLYNYHGELPSDNISTISEFMRVHFIRKVWSPASEKSVMPAALKLFMRYLDEKNIVDGARDNIKIIESEEKAFVRNLKLYTDPTSKGG